MFSSPAGRRWLFGLLYVSEGAPMGFIWWALPSLLTALGLDLATVASLSATLTLPWVGKFLMGPVIDFAVSRGQRLRSWIVTCQLCMGFMLLPLMFIDWQNDFSVLLICLFVHGCFAATQDVAIDTLAIKTVPPQELGRINGWMQTGMLAGRALVSAGAVLLVSAGFKPLAIALLILIIWLPMLALIIAKPDEPAPDVMAAAGLLDWRRLLGPGVLLGIWLALTVGAGFEFFTVSAGPLLQSFGAEQGDVAILFGVFAPLGLASGALLGGSVCARFNVRTATLFGMGFVGLAVVAIFAIQRGAPELSPRLWLGPFFVMYLATGFLIASSYALLMQLSRGDYAATRFSLFMSATNACESWGAYVGGRVSGSLGHVGAMVLLAGLSLAALPALYLLARRQLIDRLLIDDAPADVVPQPDRVRL